MRHMVEPAARQLNPTAASLLGFLTLGPMTGWDLDQLVEKSIGNFWNVTRSQVYRELRDLAARGLVAAGPPGRRDRVPYEITAAGRSAFDGWITGEPGPDLIRHRLLLTVFFSDHVTPERFAQVIAEQRGRHEETLAGYQAMRADVDSSPPMAAALRFGIAYEEMLLDWLDSLPPPAARDAR